MIRKNVIEQISFATCEGTRCQQLSKWRILIGYKASDGTERSTPKEFCERHFQRWLTTEYGVA